MNFLENYYNNYDEEGRLLRRHGQVEYLTTMHYINEILKGDKSKRILEVGAGTGRYSVTLAKEGYEVDALELVEHNLDILKSKLDGTEKICPVQGNALDLSRYGDEEFDLVLLLGPMYHLYTKEDRHKALEEAVLAMNAPRRIEKILADLPSIGNKEYILKKTMEHFDRKIQQRECNLKVSGEELLSYITSAYSGIQMSCIVNNCYKQGPFSALYKPRIQLKTLAKTVNYLLGIEEN